MFGYACNETEELMPAPVMFAHRILREWRKFAMLMKKLLGYALTANLRSPCNMRTAKWWVLKMSLFRPNMPQMHPTKLSVNLYRGSGKAFLARRVTFIRNRVLDQSHGAICNRWATGRLWINWTQNYCRYIWWMG